MSRNSAKKLAARKDAAKQEAAQPLSSRKETHASHKVAPARERMKLPNYPLLALSLAGMAVAGYLTYTGWTGAHAAFCTQGTGCDVVQNSRWATLFGAPTAFWGLLSYTALAAIALRVRRAAVHWQLAWIVALVGLGVSLYLTAISVLVLQTTCVYCLTSLGILAAIVALLAWRRPEGIEKFAWPGWLLQSGAVAAVVVVALHVNYSGWLDSNSGPEDPYLKGLAIRLTEAGAKFYGASWCPHCQRQKELFGPAAKRLPYVECSPGGQQAPSAPECTAQGIVNFPTWIFPGGDRVTSVLEPDALSRKVGYAGPPPDLGAK
jgi:uncharacterized membrane protein